MQSVLESIFCCAEKAYVDDLYSWASLMYKVEQILDWFHFDVKLIKLECLVERVLFIFCCKIETSLKKMQLSLESLYVPKKINIKLLISIP